MPRPPYTPPHIRERRANRNAAVRRLGHQDYDAYLKSAQWQAVKRRYRRERPWLCNLCGAEDGLHLHHTTYERVGQEHVDDLMPLCEPCHSQVHDLERRGDGSLSPAALIDEARALIGRQLLERQRAERAAQDTETLEAVRAQMEALPFSERLRRARQAAKRNHVNISHDVFLLRGLIDRKRAPKILWRQLGRIESKAYGQQYWA